MRFWPRQPPVSSRNLLPNRSCLNHSKSGSRWNGRGVERSSSAEFGASDKIFKLKEWVNWNSVMFQCDIISVDITIQECFATFIKKKNKYLWCFVLRTSGIDSMNFLRRASTWKFINIFFSISDPLTMHVLSYLAPTYFSSKPRQGHTIWQVISLIVSRENALEGKCQSLPSTISFTPTFFSPEGGWMTNWNRGRVLQGKLNRRQIPIRNSYIYRWNSRRQFIYGLLNSRIRFESSLAFLCLAHLNRSLSC